MYGETQEGCFVASGEGGAAEDAAGDGLKDGDGVAVTEVKEDDGVEDVEDGGEKASGEDRFEGRWVLGFAHGPF